MRLLANPRFNRSQLPAPAMLPAASCETALSGPDAQTVVQPLATRQALLSRHHRTATTSKLHVFSAAALAAAHRRLGAIDGGHRRPHLLTGGGLHRVSCYKHGMKSHRSAVSVVD